ncbi:MAG TPA: aminotransferase class IV [Myxococcota bacterium]|jgi:branched-chain amino acid aminotransferase
MSSANASPPNRTLWLDGALAPWEAARVHVLSQSLARGSLIFDYMSVHETPRGPAIFRLGDHIERFVTSARLVGLPLAQDAATLGAACKAVVRANPGAKVVKLNAYLASEEVDVVPADDRVSVAALAYDPWADVLLRKQRPPARPPKTVKLWVEKELRQRRADILHPHAKVAGNYTSPMIAKWRARRAGYDEIVLLDERGCLTETPTANFFLVDAAGALRTAPDDAVLLGITRRSVLELARAESIKASEEPIPLAALATAREAFLSGTSAGVWPIESADGRPIGRECPGPVTRALRERYQRVVSGADAAFAHWLEAVSD